MKSSILKPSFTLFKGVIGILLVLASCKGSDPQDTPIVNFGYNYLPLEVGEWIEYKVDSTAFDEFNQTVETFNFFQREEVVETYQDLEGRDVFRIELFRKSSQSDAYQIQRTFEVLVYGQRAERKDAGVRVVPLVFPTKEGADWDGNAFNTKAAESFEYDYVDNSATFNGNSFDSTLRVLKTVDTNNFVIKEFAEERYARNVGLIYQEELLIETQFGVDSGLHVIRTIFDWSDKPAP